MVFRFSFRSLILASLVFLPQLTALGQDTVAVKKVFTFATPEPPWIGRPGSVVRLASGQYVTTDSPPPGAEHTAYLFGPDGSFVRAWRRGQGPGELTDSYLVALAAGDTLLIFERRGISVFSPKLDFVRRVESGLHADAFIAGTVLQPDGLWLNDVMVMPGQQNVHLTRLGKGFTVDDSMVLDPGPFTPSRRAKSFAVASHRGGGVWAMNMFSFDIELRDARGGDRTVLPSGSLVVAANQPG
jgi:hypothetical protein